MSDRPVTGASIRYQQTGARKWALVSG